MGKLFLSTLFIMCINMKRDKDIWEIHEEAVAEFKEKLRRSQWSEEEEKRKREKRERWQNSAWYKALQVVGAVIGVLITLVLLLFWW